MSCGWTSPSPSLHLRKPRFLTGRPEEGETSTDDNFEFELVSVSPPGKKKAEKKGRRHVLDVFVPKEQKERKEKADLHIWKESNTEQKKH